MNEAIGRFDGGKIYFLALFFLLSDNSVCTLHWIW